MSQLAEQVQHPFDAARAAGRDPFRVRDLGEAEFGRKPGPRNSPRPLDIGGS